MLRSFQKPNFSAITIENNVIILPYLRISDFRKRGLLIPGHLSTFSSWALTNNAISERMKSLLQSKGGGGTRKLKRASAYSLPSNMTLNPAKPCSQSSSRSPHEQEFIGR